CGNRAGLLAEGRLTNGDDGREWEESAEAPHNRNIYAKQPAGFIPGRPFDTLSYALVLLARTLNSSASPAIVTWISSSSPRENSPTRILSESGSSTNRWIARLSGRAPY